MLFHFEFSALSPALSVQLPPVAGAVVVLAVFGVVIGLAMVWYSYRMEESEKDDE